MRRGGKEGRRSRGEEVLEGNREDLEVHPAVGPLLGVLSAPCCEAVSCCGAGQVCPGDQPGGA